MLRPVATPLGSYLPSFAVSYYDSRPKIIAASARAVRKIRGQGLAGGGGFVTGYSLDNFIYLIR